MQITSEFRPVYLKTMILSQLSKVFKVPFIRARAGFNTFYLFALMLFIMLLIVY